jgi:hypothetical protein
MKIDIHIPYIGKSKEYKLWLETRDGYEITLPTRAIYLRADSENPAYLSIRLLGFGFSLSWSEPPDLFEEF